MCREERSSRKVIKKEGLVCQLSERESPTHSSRSEKRSIASSSCSNVGTPQLLSSNLFFDSSYSIQMFRICWIAIWCRHGYVFIDFKQFWLSNNICISYSHSSDPNQKISHNPNVSSNIIANTKSSSHSEEKDLLLLLAHFDFFFF
jgi:hypothetical protein